MFTFILKIESRKTVMSQTKVLCDSVCAKTLMVSILWVWKMLGQGPEGSLHPYVYQAFSAYIIVPLVSGI